MRAIQFTQFGPPSVLALVERPDPVAKAGMAVVAIKAASVNPSDVKNVSGNMEGTVLPRIPGRDFSGVAIDGPKEWMGAEVWGTGGDVGFTIDGTHATHIVIPAEALVRKPKNLSHEQAASIGVNFIVAWLGAVTYGAIQKKETIVIIGAGGGVGGAVAQIAKTKGLRLIGVDRSPPPADAPVTKLLDHMIIVKDGFFDEVKKLTDDNGADIVFDAVGGIMFEPALKCLGHRGRLIEISATGKKRVEFDVIDFYHQEQRIIGADSRKLDIIASSKLLGELVPGFESGQYVAPLIAATYPLEKAADAYEAVTKGTAGRVVIKPVTS